MLLSQAGNVSKHTMDGGNPAPIRIQQKVCNYWCARYTRRCKISSIHNTAMGGVTRELPNPCQGLCRDYFESQPPSVWEAMHGERVHGDHRVD